MKSVMRMRHYCDHCKKSGGSKAAMVKHEAKCVKNPNRVCNLCDMSCNEQQPLAGLIELLHDKGFAALKDAVDDCPCCILAVMVQGSQPDQDGDCNHPSQDNPKFNGYYEWNFKEAMKEFWSSYNDNHREFY